MSTLSNALIKRSSVIKVKWNLLSASRFFSIERKRDGLIINYVHIL